MSGKTKAPMQFYVRKQREEKRKGEKKMKSQKKRYACSTVLNSILVNFEKYTYHLQDVALFRKALRSYRELS